MQMSFVWGDFDSASFTAPTLRWTANILKIPLGRRRGKQFVSVISRLFCVYSEYTTLEPIDLKAITVLLVLALQKPASTPKSKQLSACLEYHLALWSKA